MESGKKRVEWRDKILWVKKCVGMCLRERERERERERNINLHKRLLKIHSQY